jgi:lysosomal alpha-mannosidase
MGFFKLWYDE